DFTRKRKLPFPTLIVFIIDLATGSYQNELNRFFRILVPSDLPMKFISKVALAKARLKFSYNAFVELSEQILEHFYN
ncbi:MAG: IS4/IS5 family transposase, partial [Gammaproteobacteria bacterium]